MKPRNIPPLTNESVMRFWRLVDIGPANQCWLWKGSTTVSKGFAYGAWEYCGLVYKPHRIAYTLLVGPIPEGLTLDHVRDRGCVSKLCCNPKHLEPVTQSVNTKRQFTSVDRLYRLTCKHGHAKVFGVRQCRPCNVIAVANTMKSNPAKYGPMRAAQKRKERARLKD